MDTKAALKRIADLRFCCEVAAGYCVATLWFLITKYCFLTLPVILHSEGAKTLVVIVAGTIMIFGWPRLRGGLAVGPLVFLGTGFLVVFVPAWYALAEYGSLACVVGASFLVTALLYLAYTKARKDYVDQIDQARHSIDEKVSRVLKAADYDK